LQSKRVNAVIFDLGDTLLNFGRVNMGQLFRRGAKASYKFLKEHNQPTGSFRRYCFQSLFSLRLRYILSILTRRDFDSLELLRKIGCKKGFKLSEQDWQDFAWLWYRPLSETAWAEEDLQSTLGKLKDQGLKLGILSNTFINKISLEKDLVRFGILDFFDVRMYSYEFPCRKPNRQIFRIASERIGEPLKRIAFVGDRVNKDIKPALKLGMTAILKDAHTNSPDSAPRGARKIKSLKELPELIRQINECN